LLIQDHREDLQVNLELLLARSRRVPMLVRRKPTSLVSMLLPLQLQCVAFDLQKIRVGTATYLSLANQLAQVMNPRDEPILFPSPTCAQAVVLKQSGQP